MRDLWRYEDEDRGWIAGKSALSQNRHPSAQSEIGVASLEVDSQVL